jgi:LCP family protein required for cell wall assembly
MNLLNKVKLKRPSRGTMVFWVLAVVVSIAGYFFVRNLVTCWVLTALPGMPPATCETVTGGAVGPVVTNSQGTPVSGVESLPPPAVAIPESSLPPAWDGASRVTILILGLDARDEDSSAPRSDTMILLTIDPITKTMGMLNIRRDLWVNIPGFGHNKINTAYSFGEANKLPDGGPGLALLTVEQFIGVDIQYYAQIEMNTFAQFINRIGGVWVYNDETLYLLKLDGKRIKLTCCDMRHLDGEMALAYARCRYESQGCSGGDFGRAQRQQKLILAIRDKVLDPANFPSLIAQAPEFYNEFSAGIRTNMDLETAIQLAVLAKDIPTASIKQGAIGTDMVLFDNVVVNDVDEAVLKPLPDKIRELSEEIFTSGGAINPLAPQDDLAVWVLADAARVRILNGSFAPGLETRTGNYLAVQGMTATEYGPADRAYDRTVVVLFSPKLYTLKYLKELFKLDSNALILISPDPASTVDVEIRLGNDWANNNPMP